MPVIRRLCCENGTHLVHGCDPWQVTLGRLKEIERQARDAESLAEHLESR